MTTSRAILIPIDGTPDAEAALPYGAGLAARTGARLLLVRAISPRVPPWEDPSGRCSVAAQRARESLVCAAKRVHRTYPVLDVGVSLPVGSPVEAILDEAALERADYIVMSVCSAGSADVAHIGRAPNEILARAEIPILLIRPTACLRGGATAEAAAVSRWPADAPTRLRVVVPVDGSAATDVALAHVLRLAADLPTSTTLLLVLPADEGACSTLSGVYGDVAGADLTDAGVRGGNVRRLNWATGAAYCHRAANWMAGHGVSCQVEIRTSGAASQIALAAHDAADLIILPHVQAGVTPWHCLTTVHQLLRLTRLPVLAVPVSRGVAARASLLASVAHHNGPAHIPATRA